MGLLGLLGFALQCFDILAPLFALLYPLYSSIRAIETNSISDTHKLNTYWVVFSLILLFEHAFMKLLECFSLWPYMRLLIVFYLVIPHFDGALYVYKHLICPCLSMDPQIIFSLFKMRKESWVRENFLSEVERYVKENGYEGLENFISSKSISIKPNGGQNGMQVSEAEPILTVNKDKSSAMQMKEKTIEVAADKRILETPPSKKAQKELTAVSVLATQTDAKNIEVAADRGILKTPPPKKVQGELTAVCPLPTQTDATFNFPLGGNKHKATYEAKPNLTLTENYTVPAVKFNEKPIQVGTGTEHPQSPKQVQKEWTCALCQVTTKCETTLNAHLQGRKHKASYDALKARNQAFVPTNAPASTAKTSHHPSKEPGKSIPSSGVKQKVTSNEHVQAQKKISPITKLDKPKEVLVDGVSSNGQKGKSQQPKRKRRKHKPGGNCDTATGEFDNFR
ncbi:hypothetical protein ACLB2K_016668 [Fragaria x ananassa]